MRWQRVSCFAAELPARKPEEDRMNKMRRTDRELSREEAMNVLVEGEYGILSTVGTDGQPYAVPVNYAVDQDLIYIHGTNQISQKNTNLSENSGVCFTVVGKTEVLPSQFSTNYESAVVIGTAARSREPEKGLMRLVEKYSPEFAAEGMKYIQAAIDKVAVFEIRIEQLTGKARRTI